MIERIPCVCVWGGGGGGEVVVFALPLTLAKFEKSVPLRGGGKSIRTLRKSGEKTTSIMQSKEIRSCTGQHGQKCRHTSHCGI